MMLFIRLNPTTLLKTRNSVQVVDLYLQIRRNNSKAPEKGDEMYSRNARSKRREPSATAFDSICHCHSKSFYVRAASLELDTFSLVVLSHPYIVIFELPDYSLLPTPLPKKRKYYVSDSFCLFRNILILVFAS